MFEDLKPHLIELRKRLIISCVALIVAFGICFGFWQILLDFMIEPLKISLPAKSDIIFKEVTEPFFTAMKVSFFAGLMLAVPVIFWQFWLFVAPGLYDNEKKYVIPFVLSATAMFGAGAAFCYYFTGPSLPACSTGCGHYPTGGPHFWRTDPAGRPPWCWRVLPR